MMAFITLEDLVGTVEIVVFPDAYAKYSALLMEDAKIFVKGRVALEEEKDGKILCEQIASFEDAANLKEGEKLFPDRFGRGNRSGGFGNSSYNNGYGRGNGYASNGNGANGYGPNGYGSNGNASNGNASNGYGSNTRNAGNAAPIKKVPDGVWVQFANNEEYLANEAKLFEVSADSDGSDDLIVFLKDTKAFKVLPPNRKVSADAVLKAKLEEAFGQGNVKYVGKSIENGGKMN